MGRGLRIKFHTPFWRYCPQKGMPSRKYRRLLASNSLPGHQSADEELATHLVITGTRQRTWRQDVIDDGIYG